MNTNGTHPEPDTRIDSDPAYDFAEDAPVEDWDADDVSEAMQYPRSVSSLSRVTSPRQRTATNGWFRWTRTTSFVRTKATKPKAPF